MKIPALPPVGSLIAYDYLWSRQATQQDDGTKTRPCAVVLAVDVDTFESPLAYVVAISHSPPRKGQRALPMPAKLARHLGLDAAPKWIYCDEINVFGWPGPDLQPADRLSSRPTAVGTCVIGPLPTDWFESVKAEIAVARREQQLKATKRTS